MDEVSTTIVANVDIRFLLEKCMEIVIILLYNVYRCHLCKQAIIIREHNNDLFNMIILFD